MLFEINGPSGYKVHTIEQSIVVQDAWKPSHPSKAVRMLCHSVVLEPGGRPGNLDATVKRIFPQIAPSLRNVIPRPAGSVRPQPADPQAPGRKGSFLPKQTFIAQHGPTAAELG